VNGDEKVIYVPSNLYTLRLKATGDGKMDYSVMEYNSYVGDGNPIGFTNVTLAKGREFRPDVKNLNQPRLYVVSGDDKIFEINADGTETDLRTDTTPPSVIGGDNNNNGSPEPPVLIPPTSEPSVPAPAPDLHTSEPPASVASSATVALDRKAATLGVGEKLKVIATMTPTNSTTALTFSSSNAKVATVTASGGKATITAKQLGVATITATTVDGKQATTKVTVKKAPKKITLNKKSLKLKKKKSFKLKVKFPNGTYSAAIKWTSSKNRVASVDDNGKVTAKKKGTTTITARTFNGKRANIKVTVR
jgi:uncharacterized protein YjdB